MPTTNKGEINQRTKDSRPLIGRDLTKLKFRSADGKQRFVLEVVKADTKRKNQTGRDILLKKGDIVQNSIVDPDLWWRVKQTKDTVDPQNRDYNVKSAYAKTMQKDNTTWGDKDGKRGNAGPSREQQCHLLRLPYLVGDKLFWLPSEHGGEPQNAKPPQRGRRFAKLYYL